VNSPPAKAGGFGLRLEAGSIGHSADASQHAPEVVVEIVRTQVFDAFFPSFVGHVTPAGKPVSSLLLSTSQDRSMSGITRSFA